MNAPTEWRSKERYVYHGELGHIFYSSAHNKYFLENKRGQKKDINQDFAQTVHNTEEVIHPGRPGFFPGEKVVSNTITLPVRIWEKLEKPYSPTIANYIETMEKMKAKSKE
jgi:hypothetical protein